MNDNIGRINRRWFLRGAGGAALAIPALNSLLPPREARAVENAGRSPIFIAIANRPSNVYNNSICPTVSTYDEVKNYAGFNIQRSALRATTAGGVSKLSEVISAPSGVLTDRLVSKMNILRGLNFTKGVGHNNAFLGNLAGVGAPGEDDPPNFRVSIDQIMGRSPSFYPSFNGIRRVVLVGNDGGQSHGSWTRTTATGPIVKTPGAIANPSELFKTMFGGFMPKDARRPFVDLVKESFARVSRLNPRLSNGDRSRLGEHIALIADIERRANLSLPACTAPGAPAAFNPGPNATDHLKYYNQMSDIIVAAVGCGLTRVVVFALDFLQVLPGTDMHTECEHNMDVQQHYLLEENRRLFAEVILPLAAKLDARADGTGKSLLDRSLILRMSQMGEHSHDGSTAPIITLGGADGALKTGNYLDYRNLARPWTLHKPDQRGTQYIGLPIQQFFGSMLRVMGIPQAEWAEPNHGGYGPKILDRFGYLSCCDAAADVSNYFTPTVWSASGDVLPWLAA